jgi:hypothetical protein
MNTERDHTAQQAAGWLNQPAPADRDQAYGWDAVHKGPPQGLDALYRTKHSSGEPQ